MTKCIDLQNPGKKLMPIEFIKRLKKSTGESCKAESFPNEYENIELISRSFILDVVGEKLDIMFAYDVDRTNGNIYFGHWNDGVIAES